MAYNYFRDINGNNTDTAFYFTINKTMDNRQKNLEWNILMGLFRATCEQQTMLIGETKQHSKLIFKRWMKEGERLLKVIEKESSLDLLEEITEIFEDTAHEFRKTIKQQLIRKEND